MSKHTITIDREELEDNLSDIWAKVIASRDEAQEALQMITALKAKLVKIELDQYK